MSVVEGALVAQDLYDLASLFQAGLDAMDAKAQAQMHAIWSDIYADTSAKSASFMQEVNEWKANHPGEPVPHGWLYKNRRLESLKAQAAAKVNEYGPAMTDAALQAEQAAFLQGIHDSGKLMESVGLGSNFYTVRPEVVQGMVGFLQDGSPLKALLASLGTTYADDVEKMMLSAVANGWGPPRIARALRGITGIHASRAATIARTESMRLYRHVSHATYLANQDVLTGWTWHSRHDTRTCSTCWAMGGTIHHLHERLDGHPNCRCIMVPYTFTWKALGAKGPKGGYISGDPGETRNTLPSASAKFAQLSPAERRAILGPGKAALYDAGEIELSDLVSRVDNGPWGTMRRQATIGEAKTNAAVRKAGQTKFPEYSEAWRLGGQHVAPIKAKPGLPSVSDIEPDLLDDLAVKANQVEASHTLNTGKPVPEDEILADLKDAAGVDVPDAPPRVVRNPDEDVFPHDTSTLKVASERERLSGGAHAKETYVAEDGSLWLFKPQHAGEEFRAHLDVAASKVQRRMGFTAPDTYVVDIGGRTGSIQRVFGTADTRRPKFKGGTFDPTKLSADDLHKMQEHQALDWLIGNHDGHSDQFIRLSGSMDPIAIDKGQAFKFFGSDSLDVDYRPNKAYGVDSVYHDIDRAYMKGDLDDYADLAAEKLTPAGKSYRDRLVTMQNIPDDEYRAMLLPYAEGAYKAGRLPVKYRSPQQFLEAAVDRKNNLLADMAAHHKVLNSARAKALAKANPPAPAGLKGMTGARKFTENTGRTWARKHWDDTWVQGLTQPERNAIRHYTGSGYLDMNGSLRRGGTHQYQKALRKATGSKPIPEDIIVKRGTGLDTWRGVHPKDLVGRVAKDRGFMSTSYGEAAFSGMDVTLTLRVPKGYPGIDVQKVGSHGGSEREILLQDGATYYIHAVKRDPHNSNRWLIDAELLPPGAPPPPDIVTEIIGA